MIKILKRLTDNKYLKSVEDDLWVENITEALEMTYRECEEAKEAYSSEQLKEIVNMAKSKPMTKQEAKEMRNLLKNNQ